MADLIEERARLDHIPGGAGIGPVLVMGGETDKSKMALGRAVWEDVDDVGEEVELGVCISFLLDDKNADQLVTIVSDGCGTVQSEEDGSSRA
jgi:hypothetical protein